MKSLKDYKTEIQRCSKCGLCMSVCPVYKATGNDCAVSRGKFIMLNGVLKGDLKLSKNINKYLDMCLKCNACKDFCPSSIDAKEIFLAAKIEYTNSQKGYLKNLFAKFLNLFLVKILPIFSKFKSLFKQKRKYPSKNKKIKIVYFKGCTNEIWQNSSLKLLEKMGVEIINTKFQCCGAPFLSEGDLENFLKQAEYNLSQIPDDFDYFLTDCATCQSTFKDYEKYMENEKLKKINEKSMNVADFVVKYSNSFEFKTKTTFTYHKPCHIENIDFIDEFLSKSKNVEYIKMEDFDTCCGFAGSFALKNPEISVQITSKKIQNAVFTNADYVLTSCPSCIIGLKQGAIINKKALKIMNFVDFIAKSKIS